LDDRSTGAAGHPSAPDPDGATIGYFDHVSDIGVIGSGPTSDDEFVVDELRPWNIIVRSHSMGGVAEEGPGTTRTSMK
jgi:hypothetical protein